VKLNKEDCDAWKEVVHPSAYFLKAPTPICSEPRHYLDPCSCDALLCSDRGEKIIGVDIDRKGLTANVSADDSLGHLVNLQTLWLQGNLLEGFPTWVSKLTSLTNFSMWSNRLSGNIDAVTKLKKLEYLSLGENMNLTFQLDAVAELSSLAHLSLPDTNVSGTLDAVKKLTSLKYLHLQQTINKPACGKKENATKGQPCCRECEVHCPGQCTPGKCSCATGEFYLTSTAYPALTGSLGPLSKLTSLVEVWAEGNQLSGSLSPLSPLKDLESLILCQNNGLNGTLDPLRGLTNLNYLNVGANKLTGPVDSLYNLRSLRVLSVAFNRLTGILDSGFRRTNMPNLTNFNVGTNMFTGVPSNNVEWSRFTDGTCSLHRENFTCSADTPLPPAAKTHCGATCCVGSSADLVAGDCDAWRNFSQDPLYKKWAEGKCGAKVHTDPCSCSNPWPLQVGCTDGRITSIEIQNNAVPGGVIPLALLDLTGLETLAIGGDGLTGTIPAAIGQLQQLSSLILWVNDLHGTIPHELTTLPKLVDIRFGAGSENHLTGVLPAFNFSQFTGCCVMSSEAGFICPLPAGADKCVGGAQCQPGTTKFPPPTCK
jgi:hypothetical protein